MALALLMRGCASSVLPLDRWKVRRVSLPRVWHGHEVTGDGAGPQGTRAQEQGALQVA